MSTMNIFDLTDTWNAGGTTFTAIKMNVTDTASAAGSILIDLQVGGVSQFKVTKAGAVTAVGVAIPTISSTSTLTNKTLSSPTISGTVTGAASWSALQTFSGGFVFQITNATDLGNVANSINTVGKVQGKAAWDAVNAKLYVSSGAAAADWWFLADGSATIQPA
jgi:hypothetical protein